jgi:tetratricopeptide (TPR) repeat protein
MAESPAAPSEDGSVDAVLARLRLWCRRTTPGLAQVEFVEEETRRVLVARLRADLERAGVRLGEISLPAETAERIVADFLVDRLRETPEEVVSVDGFGAAFPYQADKAADAIYRLSVKRELLASTNHRQIWWVPTYLAELLEKIAPDLESWIQLKLRLTDVSSKPALARAKSFSQARPIGNSMDALPDPVAARQAAEEALRRLGRSVEQGDDPSEGIRSLVQPAIDRLRRATLDEEAWELERRSLELVLGRARSTQASGIPRAAPAGLDVFISYSGRDLLWARWIAFVLEEAGYKARIQDYDFVPGTSFVDHIHRGLKQSRLVVCLLSPAYLESRWCREEWQAALNRESLVPIRISECSPDGLLANRVYVDVVGLPETEARTRIVEGLAKRLGADGRPTRKPDFPGKGDSAPRFPGQLPAIWNIGEARNPYFTGRDDMLDRLHASLGAGKAAALTQAIQGLGGVGKTQLALEYAYRFASEYDGVWWLHAETPVTLASDYAALAPHLGVALVADQGQMVRDVRAALGQRQRMLLIFDNATDAQSIASYLPQGRGHHTIVTTRAHSWPGADPRPVQILPPDQAVKFLVNRTKQDDRSAAEDVAKRLGCLPLALEQAAAYVESCNKPLAAYAKLLARHGLKVVEPGEPFQYQSTVGTTWEISFKDVEAKCPAAADLMRLAAFLAPEPIHLGDLAGANDDLPPSLKALLADELALDEAVKVLLGYSLVRVEGHSIVIHRLVSEVMRSRMNEEESKRWLGTALRVVQTVLPFDCDDHRTWPTCSRWLSHALLVADWDVANAADAAYQATVLNQTAVYLRAKGNYSEAEDLFRRALKIAELLADPSSPTLASAVNNLALLLQDTGRLAEAESLYRRALEIDEKVLGQGHPNVARDLNNLASVLHASGRGGEAEPLLRRALQIDIALHGPGHPEVAVDLSNLASVLRDAGRLGEAESLFRRALEILSISFGQAHAKVATALSNLASVLEASNRLTEAEPLHRQALEIDEATLGPSHPDVGVRLNNLGRLLRQTNRLEEAEPLLRRSLAIFKASFADDHPSVAIAMINLALLLQSAARLIEAEPLLRRALEILEASLGPDHPNSITARKNLDILLAEMAGSGS